MGIRAFTEALLYDGRVRVAGELALPPAELRLTDKLLLRFEARYREHLPGAPPDLCLPAARFGAVKMYRACQFLVFRDLGEAHVRQELGDDLAMPRGPSVDYSVDLTCRFLPDVYKMSRGASPGDPLVAELERLARRWPLSSAGVPAGSVDVTSFVDDSCLRRLYVDRIIARRDVTRLDDDRVRSEILRALGAYPELSAEIARAVGLAGDAVPAADEQNSGGKEKGQVNGTG